MLRPGPFNAPVRCCSSDWLAIDPRRHSQCLLVCFQVTIWCNVAVPHWPSHTSSPTHSRTLRVQAIMDAIAANDLEGSFHGLPWDDVVGAEFDRKKLYACLDAASREEAAVAGIVGIKSGNARHQNCFYRPLDLIFPLRPPRDRPPLTGPELSPLQRRAVRAIASAMASERRIFYGLFRLWGLPETSQNLRALASDDGPSPTDNLP
jgi:hypothetical protein